MHTLCVLLFFTLIDFTHTFKDPLAGTGVVMSQQQGSTDVEYVLHD